MSNPSILAIFLALVLPFYANAQKKFQFEKTLPTVAQLEKMPEQERRLAQQYGFFSNSASGESSFDQAMEIIRIPVWFELWEGQEKGWIYMNRFYPNQPNRLALEYLVAFELKGDSMFVKQYLFTKQGQAKITSENNWRSPQAFKGLGPEDLKPLGCDVLGIWQDQAWHFNTLGPCPIETALGLFAGRYTSDLKLEVWEIYAEIRNANGQIIYDTPKHQPQVFRRLSQKEVAKKIKSYQKL